MIKIILIRKRNSYNQNGIIYVFEDRIIGNLNAFKHYRHFNNCNLPDWNCIFRNLPFKKSLEKYK